MVFRITKTVLSLCAFLSVYFMFPSTSYAQQKVIYLTFDDGPGGYTPQILNVLHRKHVRATFFVLGYRCRQMPNMVRRMKREGHEIASHGYDHQNLLHKPESTVKQEVRMADRAITQVVGQKPRYYRPTYGGIDRREIPMIRGMGHSVVFWNVDSLDWKARSASVIVQNVTRTAGPGSIVLFHDGISQSRFTAKALSTIIDYYRSRGYVFKTL